MGEQNNFTRRMFIKGIATSFGALPVFAWPRWAQAFYYNLGFFKKGSSAATYVEDVFSTYLYTGNGTSQTITNGIDLASKGGLVWTKGRSFAWGNQLIDTVRGVSVGYLASHNTNAQLGTVYGVSAFNSNGYSLQSDAGANTSGDTYASWTFRKAAKFFDVVTYTGDGTANRNIAHALGVAPGMIAIKRTNSISDWYVYHRGWGFPAEGGRLNGTEAFGSTYKALESADPTITTFTPAQTNANINGATYVAYLFAHDISTDGLIQCGSFVEAATSTITLGWEPQAILAFSLSGGDNWEMVDTSRELSVTNSKRLLPNLPNSENATSTYYTPTATGFKTTGYFNGNSAFGFGRTIIYLAIRRGLMKVPTDATKVFTPIAHTSTGVSINVSTSFPVDCLIIACRTMAYGKFVFHDRLRGEDKYLVTYSSGAEASASAVSVTVKMDRSDGVSITDNNMSWGGNSGQTYVYLALRRAAGFFDQVCYSGNDVASRTVTHGLKVAPEFMIVKSRGTGNWYVWYSPDGTAILNSSAAGTAGDRTVFGAVPTSSVFTCDNASVFDINASGVNYIAYLFASCPGVSKIGSYTGNGSSQTINCGFAAGARFILIKRTDAAGDWYAWDSARGIGAASDPHLSLNSSAVEVTTDDSIDPDNSGFIVNQVTATNINVSGASYIFMAIA